MLEAWLCWLLLFVLVDFRQSVAAWKAFCCRFVSPRAAQAKAKTVTDAIGRQFTKADAILNDVLDNLVLQFKSSQPTFYSDYQNARIIVDRGGGRSAAPTPPTPPPAKPA